MQTYIDIYENHTEIIEKFIFSSLHGLRNPEVLDASVIQRIMKLMPSIEAIYESDTTYTLISSIFLRDSVDQTKINTKLPLTELEAFKTKEMVLPPYLSVETGHLVVTAIIKTESGYRFFDFNLISLLKTVYLLPSHQGFIQFQRISYLFMGAALIFFALFSTAFGLYSFSNDLFIEELSFSLETIFKPVISVTLGLAFFDLGKTIIQHEVLKNSELLEAFDSKSFITFMTSIIIALSIETLLSVFKASLTGFENLSNVAILIISISFLLFVFSYFVINVGVWRKD